MNSTFLVEISVPDTDLITYAEDIQNDLQSLGHEVLSCKPWARPSMETAIPSLAVPPPPSS